VIPVFAMARIALKSFRGVVEEYLLTFVFGPTLTSMRNDRTPARISHE